MTIEVQGTRVGHRETKKLRTREEILRNAIAFFCRQGVRTARSVAIAEASQVSPATLFNYFPTRSALAAAWVRGELVRVFQAEALKAGAGGLRGGLRRACDELARLSSVDPAARFEAWQIAGGSRDPVVAELQKRFVVRIASEQEENRLRSDLAPSEIASLLVDAAEGALVRALRRLAEDGTEEVDEETLASAIRARVDLVLDGARKRNERVAVPGSTTSPDARASKSADRDS